MYRKFPSLGNPLQFGFVYESGAMDIHAEIESRFRMFHTYGDGMTQHSVDWSVRRENLVDYFYSLASVMATDKELADSCGYLFESGPDVPDIVFASTVLYDEKRKRYYSLKERKVSSSGNKRNDRRWEEVPTWADGTPKSMYRLLLPDYAKGLMALEFATAIHDWVWGIGRDKDLWMETPTRFLEWFTDQDEARRLQSAYEACRNLARAHRLNNHAVSLIEHYKERLVKQPVAQEGSG